MQKRKNSSAQGRAVLIYLLPEGLVSSEDPPDLYAAFPLPARYLHGELAPLCSAWAKPSYRYGKCPASTIAEASWRGPAAGRQWPTASEYRSQLRGPKLVEVRALHLWTSGSVKHHSLQLHNDELWCLHY